MVGTLGIHRERAIINRKILIAAFALIIVALLTGPALLSVTDTGWRGTVLNRAGEAPIEGASVVVATEYITTTDENGQFELYGIPEGTHNVSISKVGFVEYTDTLTWQDGQVRGSTIWLSGFQTPITEPVDVEDELTGDDIFIIMMLIMFMFAFIVVPQLRKYAIYGILGLLAVLVAFLAHMGVI